MDVTATEFDPMLDEPRWNVIVETSTKKYTFKQIGDDQMKKLRRMCQGYDYEYEVNGSFDFIWAQPVERVIITKGKTQREIKQEREFERRMYSRRY